MTTPEAVVITEKLIKQGFDFNTLKPGLDAARKSMMSPNAGLLAGVGAKYAPLAVGGYKAYKGYRDAKDRGEDTGSAVLQGAMGGLSGAMTGALAGTAAGAGAGMLLKNNKTLQGLAGANKELTNKGLRQVHGFTGFAPEVKGMNRTEALHSIGIGHNLETAAKQVEEHTNNYQQALQSGDVAAAAKAKASMTSAQRAHKALGDAHNFYGPGEGLTSLPAYAKGLVRDPVRTITTAGKEMMAGGGDTSSNWRYIPLGMAGLGALSLPGQLHNAGKDGNPGKGEVIGNFAGNTVGSFLGAGVPFVPGQLIGHLSHGMGEAGGMVGKGVDKVRGYLRTAPPEATSPEQQGY